MEGVGWRGWGGGEVRSINILWSHGIASDGACPIWSRLPSHSHCHPTLVWLFSHSGHYREKTYFRIHVLVFYISGHFSEDSH